MPVMEGTRQEFEELKDILSMWIEGCEKELNGAAVNVPEEDVHWAAQGMRDQMTRAMEMHLRLEVILNDG